MIAGPARERAIRRIVGAVVKAEVVRLRGAGGAVLPAGDWQDACAIGDGGLGLDSLERMGAIGAIGEFLGLDQPATGVDRVADWMAWAASALARDDAAVTVATSGSTGRPTLCPHRWAVLEDEAAFFAGLLRGRQRIVALVPAHHLYGLIWTALLPAALDVPVIPAALDRPLALRPGDLVVGVPEQWQALLRLTRTLPDDVWGASSGGPLSVAIEEQIARSALAGMLDIYGSSETSAIAIRTLPGRDHQLLPRWTLAVQDGDLCLRDREGTMAALPDLVERTGACTIRPAGRRDGAVQVGGQNVWPGRVADRLRAVPGVAEIAVRLGANGRLKAFVVPTHDREALAADLDAAAAALAEPERPKAFRFGTALPRNAMGKLADWD